MSVLFYLFTFNAEKPLIFWVGLLLQGLGGSFIVGFRMFMRDLSQDLIANLKNSENLLQFLQLGRHNWFTKNKKSIAIGLFVYFIIMGIVISFLITTPSLSEATPQEFPFYYIEVFYSLLLVEIFAISFYFFLNAFPFFRFEPKEGVKNCLKGIRNIISDSLKNESGARTPILINDFSSAYKMLLEESYIYFDEYLSDFDHVISWIKDLPLYFTNIYLILKYGKKNELDKLLRVLNLVILFFTYDDLVRIISLLEERLKDISPQLEKTSDVIETSFHKLKPIFPVKRRFNIIPIIIGALELIILIIQAVRV